MSDKMKVGIFETEHFEGSYPVIRAYMRAGHEITIFCYENTYRQFKFLLGEDVSRLHWIIKNENTSTRAFIKKIQEETNSQNLSLLYLNTISNNYFFYSKMIKNLPIHTRVVLTIHNINSWFRFIPAFSLRRIVRYTGRKLLLRKVSLYNVVAIPMKPALEKRLGKGKKVFTVPGAFYDEKERPMQTYVPGEPLRVAIPGSIDDRRRNYRFALSLLKRCDDAGLNIHMTFLGAPYGEYGKNIINESRNMNLKHCRLNVYEDNIVDQPEFDRVLDEAHFILTPSAITTNIEDDVIEIYGKTMSSGNVFDVIKHAKPFLIPRELQIDDYLSESSFSYANAAELITFFNSVITGKLSYSSLSDAAVKSSKMYTLDKIIERNKELFVEG